MTGNSIIKTNRGDFSIEDLWRYSIEKNEYKNGKLIAYLPEYSALSLNKKKQQEFKKIKYILKHRVKKKMFRISIGDCSVDITEDHSIIVSREGNIISVKPTEIRETDKLLKIC